jgi:hypothetical protein
MRNRALLVAVAALVTVCLFSANSFAQSAESKMVGVVKKIEISGQDATTATVTLEDTKTEALVEIVINDELTLDKLKDHRIVEGDEIRCKYTTADGKNVSSYFRKTAGC